MDEDKDEDEMTWQRFTGKIVPAIAKALPEQSIRIERFIEDMHTKHPKLASRLELASVICKTVGKIPGAQPMTLFGIILAGASTVLDPEARQRNFSTKMQLKDVSKQLKTLEEKTDKILDIITDMAYKKEMRFIRNKFNGMTEAVCIEVWADSLYNSMATFDDNLVSFREDNLKNLFNHIYENKCDDNLEELYGIYEYVITTRLMYLQITSACYTHCTTINKRYKEPAMIGEFERFTNDIEIISESMTAVCNFFHAAITLKDEDQFEPVHIPKVPEQDKLADKIAWKTEKGTETEVGKMFGPFKDYAVSVPKTQTVTFGKLTSKYRVGSLRTTYLKSGPARMETFEKTIIGQLNNENMWINGRLEIDTINNSVIYRKFDDQGKKVEKSAKELVDFEWKNYENRKPAQRSVSSIHQRMDKTPVQHGKQIQRRLTDTLATPFLFQVPLTVKGQTHSSNNMSKKVYEIPISFAGREIPKQHNVINDEVKTKSFLEKTQPDTLKASPLFSKDKRPVTALDLGKIRGFATESEDSKVDVASVSNFFEGLSTTITGPLTVKGQSNSSDNMSREVHDIPISFAGGEIRNVINKSKTESSTDSLLEKITSYSRDKRPVTAPFQVPLTVKDQTHSSNHKSRQVHDIPITCAEGEKPKKNNVLEDLLLEKTRGLTTEPLSGVSKLEEDFDFGDTLKGFGASNFSRTTTRRTLSRKNGVTSSSSSTTTTIGSGANKSSTIQSNAESINIKIEIE